MANQTASSEEADTQTENQPASAKWWCNFCGFATDDQQQYLQHSCAEVLRQKGQTVTPTGQNECR